MDKVSIEEAKEQLDKDVLTAMVRFYERTGIEDIHVSGDTDNEQRIGFQMGRDTDYPSFTVQSKIILK